MESEGKPEHCPVCGAAAEAFEPYTREESKTANGTAKKVLIIGNGVAGIEAAKAARQMAPEAEIEVFTDESYHFYSRIHLSTLIGGEVEEKDIFIFPPVWYQEQGITVHLQTPILKIDAANKRLHDFQNRIHEYDSLIIASGAAPFIPAVPGAAVEGIFVLRNLFDARQIRTFAAQCQRVVIIGGGLLGIEAARSLKNLGLQVTVVELSEYLMPRQLDRLAAKVLESLLSGEGIEFRLNCGVERIEGKFQAESVRLTSGENIPVDMVLFSTGIVPNLQLAELAGLKVNRGVVVDEYMRTSEPDIFAAGDVAEFAGQVAGIWPAAVEQGRVAGENAVGGQAVYRPILPLHILKVAGIDVSAVGQTEVLLAGEEEIVHQTTDPASYVKLVHNRKQLLGAIVVNVPGISFRLEKLIKTAADIEEILPELVKGNWSALKKKKKVVRRR
ncbi:MAG: FAD-dependent oxidoreductase [Calditrichia bacterium]